jgi:hypothetical protein
MAGMAAWYLLNIPLGPGILLTLYQVLHFEFTECMGSAATGATPRTLPEVLIQPNLRSNGVRAALTEARRLDRHVTHTMTKYAG